MGFEEPPPHKSFSNEGKMQLASLSSPRFFRLMMRKRRPEDRKSSGLLIYSDSLSDCVYQAAVRAVSENLTP